MVPHGLLDLGTQRDQLGACRMSSRAELSCPRLAASAPDCTSLMARPETMGIGEDAQNIHLIDESSGSGGHEIGHMGWRPGAAQSSGRPSRHVRRPPEPMCPPRASTKTCIMARARMRGRAQNTRRTGLRGRGAEHATHTSAPAVSLSWRRAERGRPPRATMDFLRSACEKCLEWSIAQEYPEEVRFRRAAQYLQRLGLWALRMAGGALPP